MGGGHEDAVQGLVCPCNTPRSESMERSWARSWDDYIGPEDAPGVTVTCACPVGGWHSILPPPPCPMHSPTVTATTHVCRFRDCPTCNPPASSLSDADVNRIADRVVEKLKAFVERPAPTGIRCRCPSYCESHPERLHGAGTIAEAGLPVLPRRQPFIHPDLLTADDDDEVR